MRRSTTSCAATRAPESRSTQAKQDHPPACQGARGSAYMPGMRISIACAGTLFRQAPGTKGLDRPLHGDESTLPVDCEGSIPQVQAVGKRSAVRRPPHRRSPTTAVPRTTAIRASAGRRARRLLVVISVSSPAGGHRRQPLQSGQRTKPERKSTPAPCRMQLRFSRSDHAACNGITFVPAANASTRSARYCRALFRSAASSM